MIYLSHGVIPAHNPDRISHALFLPQRLAIEHLSKRLTKYVSLERARHGEGDALTIDDATYAGFRLALLARQYGHAVSWFINGSNVERGLQYFPFQLSCMLDDTNSSTCFFDGSTWNLESIGGRRALRLRIKEVYMGLRNQEEIQKLMTTFAHCLRLPGSATIERALTTVTAGELAQAVSTGVDLQNHGWRHLNLRMLSDGERKVEVISNEEYLAQFRQATTCIFAPPFGQHVPMAFSKNQFILLADRRLPPAYRTRTLINRVDLLNAIFEPPVRTTSLGMAVAIRNRGINQAPAG